MKDMVNQWFEQSAPFEGILACGVRHADQSAIVKTWADGFTEMAIENALRCVVDVFQVLQFNRVPPGRIRWVYQGALFHCERRGDGICLGVFTGRDTSAVDLAGLDRFFNDFQSLTGSGPM
jgi:hypothetical protein